MQVKRTEGRLRNGKRRGDERRRESHPFANRSVTTSLRFRRSLLGSGCLLHGRCNLVKEKRDGGPHCLETSECVHTDAHATHETMHMRRKSRARMHCCQWKRCIGDVSACPRTFAEFRTRCTCDPRTGRQRIITQNKQCPHECI